MTDRDWIIFREDFKIFVSGGRAPVPFRSWSESALPRDLLNAITKAGYTKPTPIQMQAIPIAMMPRDLIGISSTGSGKTAAFVLPMLFYLKSLPPINSISAADGPYALVMAPSRELALQIEQESLKFSTFCKIRVCSIVGGRSAEQQTLTLSQGVEMIVATPGRLADSLDGNQTVLNQCFYVVLDEADKMVDLGFEPYLNRILESIPTGELANGQRRITQMFSATMPVSVERLTRKYLVNPLTVTVGEFVGGAAKSEIEQRLEFTRSETEKRSKLYAVAQATEAPIIVFVNSKAAADRVGLVMDNAGYRVMVLHSGKMQQKREEAIGMFKAGSADVLVATDVAGRGIDVPDVKHVINYDLPTSIEDYTHRIGRTGRAGKSGLATSFVSPYDEPLLPELKKFMLAAKQFIPEELERVHVERNEDIGVKRKRDGVVYAK
jgi:ATP-dependent RNA helicase DDX23/PRP28